MSHNVPIPELNFQTFNERNFPNIQWLTLKKWKNLLEINFPYCEKGIYYITFWKLSWDENCTLAGYIRRKIANSLSFTTYFTSFEVMQTSISLPLLHQQQQGIRHNKSQSLKFCIQNVFWCFLMVNSRFWVPNNGHLPVSIQRFQTNSNVLNLRLKTYVNFITNQNWT